MSNLLNGIQSESEQGAIKSLLHKIVDYSPSAGVIDFIQPVPLEQELTEKLEKAIHSTSEVHTDMEETADYVMSRCVNTSHPYFLNQLYGGVHPMGLAAAYIVEKMNTNAYAVVWNSLVNVVKFYMWCLSDLCNCFTQAHL